MGFRACRTHRVILFPMILKLKQIDYLNGSAASYHEFLPRSLRPIRIVIRNATLNTVIMYDALSKEGHKVKQVYYVKKEKKNNRPYTIFFIVLVVNVNNNEL